MPTTHSNDDQTIYYKEDEDIGFQCNHTENGIADTFWIKVPGENRAEFLTSHEAYAYAKKKANGRRIMNVNDNWKSRDETRGVLKMRLSEENFKKAEDCCSSGHAIGKVAAAS